MAVRPAPAEQLGCVGGGKRERTCTCSSCVRTCVRVRTRMPRGGCIIQWRKTTRIQGDFYFTMNRRLTTRILGLFFPSNRLTLLITIFSKFYLISVKIPKIDIVFWFWLIRKYWYHRYDTYLRCIYPYSSGVHIKGVRATFYLPALYTIFVYILLPGYWAKNKKHIFKGYPEIRPQMYSTQIYKCITFINYRI